MIFPYSLGGLYYDLEQALDKRIDLVTISALEQAKTDRKCFWNAVLKERVQVYSL